MHMTIQNASGAKPKAHRILQILSLVTAAVIIITAIALAVACIHLYKTGGDNPYTRERAGKYLTVLLPFTLTCLTLVIARGVMGVIFTEDCSTEKSKMPAKAMLTVLRKKLGAADLPADSANAISNEKRVRTVWYSILLVLTILLSVAVLIFALADTDSYTIENCTEKAAYVAIFAGSAFILAAALAFVCMTVAEGSYERELAATRAALTAIKGRDSDGGSDEIDTALTSRSGHCVDILRGAILVGAIALIILGIANGSMNDVLGKAVQICTECIGLG